MAVVIREERPGLLSKPGPWVDLGLTLPIFLAYHLGVVFLRVRNGTDLVTGELLRVAEGSREMYLLLTAAIGVVFAGIFAWLGRGHAFRPEKFVQIALEGAIYAVLMRLAGAYVVTKMFAASVVTAIALATGAAATGATAIETPGAFVGTIMSFGAGFYEELTFRVLIFGLGAKALVWTFASEKLALVNGTTRLSLKAYLLTLMWAVVAAIAFSGVHYIGALGDRFDPVSFTFRFVLGLSLTLVYATRGFAAAVWTHALYDVWVLVF